MAKGGDATVPLKQTKFDAGEFSPLMYGDTSHPKYNAALKKLQNFISIPEGAAVCRPGTRFIAATKDSTAKSRLLPFIFSDSLTYILEFGNLYIRFYTLAQYVNTGYGVGTGSYYELVTTFTTAMLPFIKYKQVGNTITLCYGGEVLGVAALPPQDLVKTSGANGPWTISNTITAPPALTWGAGIKLEAAVFAYSAAQTYNIGDRATTVVSGVTTEWTCIQSAVHNLPPPDPLTLNGALTGVSGNLFWTPSVDAAHVAVKWQLNLTVVFQDAAGITYESTPQIAVVYTGVIAEDRPLPIAIGATPTPSGTALYFKYYRGQNGVLGLISQIPIGIGVPAYVDLGNAPDYTQQPPQGTDPFLINGADAYPAVVGYIDQRRAFAGSLVLPNGIQTSATGNLYRFDQPIPGQDSDSTSIVLSSDVLEQIRSFLSLKCNLVFTGEGEWVFPDQVYTRSSGGPRKLSSWGSSYLDPIAIGNGCLFNTVQGSTVRDFFPLYGIYTSIWDGDDLTTTARHFFQYNTIVTWAFQPKPYPVLWMVRDDGVLISLTYERATQSKPASTVAWAQHYTGVGPDVIESIAVVPEAPDYAVYMIVARQINGGTQRYIERMASPIPATSQYMPGKADQRYARYLDCSTLFDGHNPTPSGFPASINSVANPGSTDPADYVLSALVTVTLVGTGGASGTKPFLASDPNTANVVFDPENVLKLGTFQGLIVGYTGGTVVTVQLQAGLSQAQINAWFPGNNNFGVARSIYSVPQLVGVPQETGDASGARGVTALADGTATAGSATFVGSTLALPQPALVVNVGISYNADMQLLDAYHPSAEIRNKYKNVKRVGFEVAGARSLWIGQDFDNLVEWNERQVSDSFAIMGLSTGYFDEFSEGDWNKSGSVCLRHFDPLPCIIVSVLRELALGGD